MYDLIVIGGGPGGYSGAELAAQHGLKTLLIEKEHLGGVCLNEGCIPSKALLHSTRLFSQACGSTSCGVHADGVRLDWNMVQQRKGQVVERLRRGIESLLKKSAVDTITGKATLAGATADSFSVRVEAETFQARRLLLATGSTPVLPPLPGIDQSWVITSREMLSIEQPPQRLVVIGGGVIGLEMAQFCHEAGSQVTVVEMLPEIGGPLDPVIAKGLRTELTRRGITIRCGCTVTAFGDHAVTVKDARGEELLSCDAALVAVGRRPNAAPLGLESIGLALSGGAVCTDLHCRTSVHGVWAVGDINGVSMLAHTASREAQVAVHDMLGIEDVMRYDTIPMVIYTHPEVAVVGMTQAQALESGLSVTVQELPMGYSGRHAIEFDRERGVCRIVAQEGSGRILGAHLLGGGCSEMIYGLGAMITAQTTVTQLSRLVFPHPTVSEIFRETALRMAH